MGRDERIGIWLRRTSLIDSAIEVRLSDTGSSGHAAWGLHAGPARLESWLRSLRTMPGCPCFDTPLAEQGGSCCSEEVQADCARSLRGLGTELLDYMSENFSRENMLMRKAEDTRDLCERFDLHTEDHGSIMSSLIKALEFEHPCAQKRALSQLLEGPVRRHLMTHDVFLREQLPRFRR